VTSVNIFFVFTDMAGTCTTL